MDKFICKIEMLGGLRVRQGEREVTHIKRQKSAALLAFLAYHSGGRHPREVLCEQLWPDSEPESARNRLNVTLSRLRDELAEQLPDANSMFLSDRSYICINWDCVTTDVVEFETHLRGAARAPDRKARAHSLQRAIALYRGPLLPGFYDSWVTNEQERLREQVNRALSDLIAILEAEGSTDEAIGYARRVVAAEPLLEKAHEALIRLLIHAGRPADALQQYRALESILREELGIAPSEESRSLLESIRLAAEGPAPSTMLRLSSSVPIETSDTALGLDAPRNRKATASRSPYIKRFLIGTAAILGVVVLLRVLAFRSHPGSQRRLPKMISDTGGKLLWDWQYTPVDDEKVGGSEPSAITSDSVGSLYVTGFTRTKKHDVDFITLKFAPNNRLDWVKRWNYAKTNDCDRARKIAVDGEGSVYVMGDSYGGDREKGGTQWDVATVKYSRDGRELWTNRFDGPAHGDDWPLGMALDQAGNVYVAGTSKRADGTEQCALMKYDRSGAISWTVFADALSNGLKFKDLKIHSFTADAGGNLYVCGEAGITDGIGRRTHDLFTLRYDRHGNQVWHRRFAAEASVESVGRVVAVDRESNVYVAATVRPDSGKFAYGEDMIVIKYDPAGNEVWSTRCNRQRPGEIVIPRAIAVNPGGNVFAVASAGPKDYPRNCLTYCLGQEGRIRWHNESPHLDLSENLELAVAQDGGISLSASFDGSRMKSDLLTWRYSAKGRELWDQIVHAAPVDQAVQRAIHQDVFGNIITAARMAPADGQLPGIRILKYSP